MADKNDKDEGTVKGAFYVDTECIGCGMCAETAPDNFRMNDGGDLAIVFKQPENVDERNVCEEAKDACPAEAIGDDGE
ncbi:MAG: ferredoxin [Chitinispirillaceae bacterium]|nr:ferredoxin [Chitinispirillaceae bacterium]